MSVDIGFLEKQYFYFDKPVLYNLDNDVIRIMPISVMDSEIFLSAIHVISQDKNNIPDPKIIQMSYLQFIIEVLFQDNININALVIIAKLCLGINKLGIKKNELGRYLLVDQETGLTINQKQFDDIKSIILHQNLVGYDDEYIHPDLKKALNDVKELKNKNIEIPSMERKIAIITSHCGLSKMEQLNMTYRSHTLLFQEVCGEVEYSVTAPIATYTGKKDQIDHWIFKKKKGKFDGEVISVSDYSKNIGMDNGVQQGAASDEISKYL